MLNLEIPHDKCKKSRYYNSESADLKPGTSVKGIVYQCAIHRTKIDLRKWLYPSTSFEIMPPRCFLKGHQFYSAAFNY